MKKLCIIFCLFGLLAAFAGAAGAAEAVPQAAAVLVTDYSVSDGALQAGESGQVTIVLSNRSDAADALQCKLVCSDPSGDIRPEGTGTVFLQRLAAGDSYTWVLPVSVAENAAAGEHSLTIRLTHADGSGEDTLPVAVQQTTSLRVGSTQFPAALPAGSDLAFSVTALNTGKAELLGVLLTVRVDTVGEVSSAAVGTLAAGSGGTAQGSFSTAGYAPGSYTGSFTLRGEDVYGSAVTATGSFAFTLQAADSSNASRPRLLLQAYTIENSFVTPGETAALTMTLTNTHTSKAIQNMLLSFTAASGELYTEGLASQYVPTLAPGESYEWVLPLTAAHTAASGGHSVQLTAEYEDAAAESYSVSETLRIPVRQTAELTADGLVIPARATQGDTFSVSLSLQNTGKSTLSNVRATLLMDGFENGGSIFAGTLPAGEGKSITANCNVPMDATGEAKGSLTLQYEDDYGEKHEQTFPVSTLVTARVEPTTTANDAEASSTRLWWLFLLTGVLAGGGAGAGVVAAIAARRQRRLDEESL